MFALGKNIINEWTEIDGINAQANMQIQARLLRTATSKRDLLAVSIR